METADESKLRKLRDQHEQLTTEIADLELHVKAGLWISQQAGGITIGQSNAGSIVVTMDGVDALCERLKRMKHGDNPYLYPKP